MYQTNQPELAISKRLFAKYKDKELLTRDEVTVICDAFETLDAKRVAGDYVFDKDSHPENIIVSYPDSDDFRVTIIDFEDRTHRVKAYDDLSNLVSFGQDLQDSSDYHRFEETVLSYYQFTRYLQEQSECFVPCEPLGDIDESAFLTNTLTGVIYRAFCLYDSLHNRPERRDVRDGMITNALVSAEMVLDRYWMHAYSYRQPLQDLLGVLTTMQGRT
jgi:hypothetical protein